MNGLQFANFALVPSFRTNSIGTVQATNLGFGNNALDTGFFDVTEADILSNLYDSLRTTETAIYRLVTTSGNFQFYDFAQGLDSSIINIGTGPIVTPPPSGGGLTPIPLPAAGWLMLAGLGGLGALSRRRRKEA